MRIMLAQKRVKVDAITTLAGDRLINTFSNICVDNKVIQQNTACYLMLNKPVGVVSATKDDKHKTVLDLIDHALKSQLHIVGRLDLNTSGLVLLTNDSRWSEALTSPQHKVQKHYQVTLQNSLNENFKAYQAAFQQGMYFEFEDITTQPATIELLSNHLAQVTLTEGKYHQIKRMFGRFRNPVMALHRSQIGEIMLDSQLKSGEWRILTSSEINSVCYNA